MNNTSIRAAGILFTRALLGIIFFMQGFGIWATAYYTSYVELIGGLLLIIGLFRKQAIYLLAIDLFVVSFGHGLMEPIWDLSHVIARAVLLLVLFFAPQEWDRWHADRYLLGSGRP